MATILLLEGKLKIDQIAFGCSNYDAWLIESINCPVKDKVQVSGKAFGENIVQKEAYLSFSYRAGIEVEYLYYPDPSLTFHRHLSSKSDDIMFLSHYGAHVQDIDKALSDLGPMGLKWRVVMDVKTVSHTNEFLVKNGRKYRYVILDWREKYGYFYKLIQRIESGSNLK